MVRPLVSLAIVMLVAAAPASAQLQVATIRGVVTDAAGQAVAGMAVALEDQGGTTISATISAPDGSFRLTDVVPGAYVIRVGRRGDVTFVRPIVVRGSIPIEVSLTTGTLREHVVVTGDAAATTVEDPATIAGDAVRLSAEPIPSQRIQSALATLPGWSAEDNGLLHVRGVDDGVLYVQDGIPVYERVDRLFGQPAGPAAIASLHVMDGYVPPEFGYKAGAVVVVRSATGIAGRWSTTLDGGLADLSTRHLQGVGAGPIGRNVGAMFTASDERSSRFLDPIDLGNLHNEGRTTNAGAQVTWARAAELVTASMQGGRARHDVPNSQAQDQAGQDQRQQTSQLLLSGSWQRVRSDRTVWQASGYFRHGRSSLLPSIFDTPITAETERSADRHGALWSLNHQRGRHAIKIGGEASTMRLDERFTFAITDEEAAEEADISEPALAYDLDNPFGFADRARPWLFSVYVQDAFRASDRLTVNAGVRFDRTRLLVDAWQLSPRAGVAFAARPGTTLRASIMRLFQPPQAEYLLLSSSEEARVLSPFVDDDEIGGGSSIPPERQTAVDASVTQTVASGWTLDASAWLRRGTDVDDPNVFVGTTIVFPNSVARQHASGFDVSLRMQPRRGWSGGIGYTYARVVQYGPMTGGLFLEEEVGEIQDGTRFIPDHDQRHGVFASASFSDERTRIRISGTFRYQTGTPIGIDDDVDEDLIELPGSQTVDFETGRVRARAVGDLLAEWRALRVGRGDIAIRIWMNNIANQTYAFNFGNPFSGTHFGAPRRIGVGVRIRL